MNQQITFTVLLLLLLGCAKPGVKGTGKCTFHFDGGSTVIVERVHSFRMLWFRDVVEVQRSSHVRDTELVSGYSAFHCKAGDVS